ncbi:MAG: hypothetical protein NC340_09345 [Ruminococcus flavefaciens]|nr:hypothetical protein [Ruminococcus flavefaciens]MCM1230319.1 hypothetical protein [Ruminococcus flavefaciens]
MNNTAKKIISVLLCATLITGTVGAGFYAVSGADKDNPATESAVTKETKKASSDIAKDETVWVMTGADGSVNKIIVSDWLKNTAKADKLNDVSVLADIENVKGDESFTVNSDELVWEAGGQDIYYQGISENELPVGISISYELDGRSISPENLAGKSGKVKIRVDYSNNAFEMREIDGKKEKIYVPFAMLTGMILDNDVFRNVEVTNGRLVNDGMRTVVAGIAFPGLQSSLGIDKDTVEIPDFIEITADVTDFRMGMTATVATNEIFNELDTDKLDSADGLGDSLTELTDAMKQLTDGSTELYDGLCTLLEKSGELVSGVNQLADGSKSLADGAKSLDSGSAELQTGTAQLNDGLQTLVKNNNTLNSGARQVFDTLLATADSQIKSAGLSIPALTVENYGDVLNQTISSLDETNVYNQALSQVTEAVNSNRDYIASQVETAVRQQVTEQVRAVVIQQMKDKGLTDEMLQSDEVQAQITTLTESNTDTQMKSDDVQSAISEQTELQVQKLIAENMSSDEVQGKLASASSGVQSLISLKSQLDSYNAFYSGLLSYTDGVSQAADGAKKLSGGVDSIKSGASQLSKGAGDLYSGIKKLQDSTPALIDGITQLRDGALQLSDGLDEFNEKGIQKLVSAFDGDLSGLAERIRTVKSVSVNYKSFSGIGDDTDGQVKFFFRSDGIE